MCPPFPPPPLPFLPGPAQDPTSWAILVLAALAAPYTVVQTRTLLLGRGPYQRTGVLLALSVGWLSVISSVVLQMVYYATWLATSAWADSLHVTSSHSGCVSGLSAALARLEPLHHLRDAADYGGFGLVILAVGYAMYPQIRSYYAERRR